MFHFFERNYRGSFYLGACATQPFGKVSEYLKIQMNKNFKEHIENYANLLHIPCKFYCLYYKSIQRVVK
jgi:hypothetical protein